MALALGNDRAGKHYFDSRLRIRRAEKRSRHAKAGQIVAPAGKHVVLNIASCFYVFPDFLLMRGSEKWSDASNYFF